MFPRLIAFLATIYCCSAALAQTVPPARAFGARAAVEQISLSPDGNKIAYVSPTKGQGSALFVIDLASGGQSKAILAASGDPERLGGCDWVSSLRLICRVYTLVMYDAEHATLSRLVAVDADGSRMKMVSARQGINAEYTIFGSGVLIDLLPSQDGAVLLGRNYAPESKMGSIIKDDSQGYGVDRVDTLSLASKRVVSPSLAAWEYISDGIGNVRIKGLGKTAAGGYDSRFIGYYYRTADGKDWAKLGDYDYLNREGFNPVAVDPKANAVYGFEKKAGRQAVFKIALDGSMAKTEVLARPDVDVDGLVQIGRAKRIVGVSYVTEYREASYFDPELDRLHTSLGKALPSAKQLEFVDASAEERHLLLWAGADADPGQYYLYDKAARKLEPLLPSRPALADYKLASVKPVSIKASDGTNIPGYLTLPVGSTGKNLPAIVMPHGGPEARDEWGFDWLSQFFASRGFAVLQPNFRGSTGYGDEWFKQNGFKSWKVAIGDVTDSGRWLISQGIADPSKIAIVGWSYGGYAALQSAVVAPDLFKAIIAIAPVTDMAQLKQEHLNYSDYKVVEARVGSGPHIAEGSPARHADQFKAPVLMFHGEYDKNVDVHETRLMEDRLKSAGKANEVVIFPKLDHYLDDSAARELMLSKSEAFLRKSMGM
jgi:dipeptidyl aminopeptidase/acylaminoacyl peptidase